MAAVRGRIWIAAVAGGLVAGAATAIGLQARNEAQQRCQASQPSFPARVLRVDVDLRVRDLDYDCVYGLMHGGRLAMPPLS